MSVLPASFLVACSPAAEEPLPVVGPEAFASAFPTGFVAEAHCTPLAAYTPPQVGADYVFRDDNGRRSSRRIVSVDGDRIGMQYRDLSTQEQKPLPPMVNIAGLFVVGTPGGTRQKTYPVDPMATLATLQVGQSAVIAASETSTLNRRRRTVATPVTVRYLACGRLPVAESAVAVRLYKVDSRTLILDRARQEQLTVTSVVYAMPLASGFPVALANPKTASRLEHLPQG
ncbi:hypothetical protein [Brevundimonas sp.]|uniref:hypothetical protein n=1 Tax=Brevundimonas sp. TaxID=1871086 RepID=UPI003D0EEF8C